jgi:hypothetical protein
MDTGDEHMTTLTGIKDAQYLAQFLGKKIAIQMGKNRYWIYHSLSEIHANGIVKVKDSKGVTFLYTWEDCENPFILLTNSNIEWEMK